MRALLLAALLAAPVAHARVVDPADAPDEPAVPAEADEEGADTEDAVGIQEAVEVGRGELDELLKAEHGAIPDELPAPVAPGLVGPASPLRGSLQGAWDLDGELAWSPQPARLGDAGSLLAELGGLDLAALRAEYDIPVEINEDVLEYVHFFQTSGRKWFAKWLERSHRWIPIMRPILAEEGVPLDLVYLSMIESGFSPFAYSRARASGFWQFISATGRRYGLRDDFWVDERRDPLKATRAAARYLKALHREFGDWYLAWAGYNAGEGKIRRAIKQYETRDFWELTRAGRYLRPETKHYVPKLIAAAIVAKHPERFGFSTEGSREPYDFDEVEVPDATDLDVVAKAAGTTSDELLLLNLPLRRACTPPAREGKGYLIRVPRGTRDQFVAEYAKIAPSDRLTFRHHRVARGDTPGGIGAKFGVPAEAILKLNGVKNARSLRVGMDLLIPLPTQIASKYPDRPEKPAAKRPTQGTRQVASSRPPPEARPPSHGQYVIQSGDTLWSIAQRFGVEVDELKRWNGLGRRAHKALQVGRALNVAKPSNTKRG